MCTRAHSQGRCILSVVLCYLVKVPCNAQWLSLASVPSSRGRNISFEIQYRLWADMTSNTSMSGRHVGVVGRLKKMKVKRESRNQLARYDFKYRNES